MFFQALSIYSVESLCLFTLPSWPLCDLFSGGESLPWYWPGASPSPLHSVTMDNSSMVSRLFAIVAEQQRKQLVDAAHKVRGERIMGSCVV